MTPTMNWPAADPSVPVPSIMPVTVDMALALPLRTSYLPRSAEHAEEIILFNPLIKKPRKNINTKNRAVGMLRLYVITKLIVIDIETAPNATGERFPYMRSDMYPNVILPNMAPRSMTVERLATWVSL